MALFYKVNGIWKKCDIHYKNSSGWKEVKNIFHKVGTTWRPIWNYFWETSNWSGCSVTCGGGIQTRTSVCKRSDGFYKADSFCLSENLDKPILEQVCNTQPCYSLVTKVCGGYTGGVLTWTWSGTWINSPTDYRTYSVYVLTNVGCAQCGSRQSRFKDGWYKLSSPVLTNPQTITWTFAYSSSGRCLGGNYRTNGTKVASGCQGAKCQYCSRCGPNNLDASCYAHRRYIGNYSHEPNKPFTHLTYIVQSYANYWDHERVLNNIRFELV